MKKITIFLIIFILTFIGFLQCDIDNNTDDGDGGNDTVNNIDEMVVGSWSYSIATGRDSYYKRLNFEDNGDVSLYIESCNMGDCDYVNTSGNWSASDGMLTLDYDDDTYDGTYPYTVTDRTLTINGTTYN